jgi:hypothetical protein
VREASRIRPVGHRRRPQDEGKTIDEKVTVTAQVLWHEHEHEVADRKPRRNRKTRLIAGLLS